MVTKCRFGWRWGVLGALLLGCAAPAPRRPNVVLITLDTFRADLLAAHGAPDDLTPELNRFADEAVLFEDAVTSIGTTFPAHASLFTGLYPRHHGVLWNGDGLNAEFHTLAERLRDAGYQTAAFVSLPSMIRRGGLGQGFEDQIEVPSGPASPLDAAAVNAAALDWLDERDSTPFFVWLHYFETHSPYRLTRHAKEEFSRSGYRGPLAQGASTEVFYALGDTIAWTQANRKAIRALYEGEAVELDTALGEILGFLRQSGLLESSLVVITADHGQALGEHDVVGHGFLLWQPVVSVPMLIRVPGTPRPGRVETRVGIIDLQATILDHLGLPPATDSGRSLLPALAGVPLVRRPYFVETREAADAQPLNGDEEPSVAVLLDRHKLIRWPDQWLWFDLQEDPLEVGSSAASGQEQARLRRQIEEFLAQPAFDSEPRELDREDARELRALGYIQ